MKIMVMEWTDELGELLKTSSLRRAGVTEEEMPKAIISISTKELRAPIMGV